MTENSNFRLFTNSSGLGYENIVMILRLIQTFMKLLSFIPLPVGRFIGKILGMAAYFFPLNRKAVVVENLRSGFGNTMDAPEINRLVMKVYLHFGQMLFEIPHIFRMNADNLEQYIVFKNEENIRKALEKGKGVFGLTGHFGNWEFMSAAFPIRFGNITIVVRPIDFKPMEDMIYNLRTRFGADIIYKQKAMRRILGAVKANKIVGILLDQNVDWYEGAFVKFLGRWACTNKGLALLALKTGTPVVPIFPVRQPDGRYCIVFEKEVELIRTGDKTRDVEDNTALFAGIIEKYIRKYPDQWFWFHRRWKTRPYCHLPDSFYL